MMEIPNQGFYDFFALAQMERGEISFTEEGRHDIRSLRLNYGIDHIVMSLINIQNEIIEFTTDPQRASDIERLKHLAKCNATFESVPQIALISENFIEFRNREGLSETAIPYLKEPQCHFITNEILTDLQQMYAPLRAWLGKLKWEMKLARDSAKEVFDMKTPYVFANRHAPEIRFQAFFDRWTDPLQIAVYGSFAPTQEDIENGLKNILADEVEEWSTFGKVQNQPITQQSAPATSTLPPSNHEQKKQKRQTDDAERRKLLVYQQYDLHMKDGYNHETALKKLVINLKREFRTADPMNRRKSIIRLLKQRNIEEQ